MQFSDYIVYVDESGDHHLEGIDENYPIFSLAFCIFDKQEYVDQVTCKIQKCKFQYFGHDSIIFHENDIRKRRPPFNNFRSREVYDEFVNNLATILQQAPMKIVASVINKKQHVSRYAHPRNPYHLSLLFCVERLVKFLQTEDQTSKLTYILVEKRGSKEDAELELEFRRICDQLGVSFLEIVFVAKKINSGGLQLADLVARPIGLKVLRPKQENRAYEIIEKKFHSSKSGQINGCGLKIFP